MAKAPGHLVLSNGPGTQVAEIDIHGSSPPMPPDVRWILQPIDGQFVQTLWSSGTSGGSIAGADTEGHDLPSYFYEDRGANGSHVRAIREDGLQAWQWPNALSREVPRIICGDSFGGVVVQIGDQLSRTLVNLDAYGHERWRAPAPGFRGKDFTYSRTDTFYFVEDSPNLTGASIVGLDALDGQQRFSLELPVSREILRGLAVRNGVLICSPRRQLHFCYQPGIADWFPTRRASRIFRIRNMNLLRMAEIALRIQLSRPNRCVSRSLNVW